MMRVLFWLPAILFVLHSATGAVEVELTGETRVHFATAEEAISVLGSTDDFVARMSPFDRAARMQTANPVSKATYLQFVTANVLDWEPSEVARVKRAIAALRERLGGFAVPLPQKIFIIKTTGREEGDAPYTRANAIVLPRSRLRTTQERLEYILAHELLHIVTRNNQDLRGRLYATIGFHPCNEIELPHSLKARKITNPDAPRNDHYIRVILEGKPATVVPILFSSTPTYDPERGGKFFDYMVFRLLVVEREPEGGEWKPVFKDGEALCIDVSEVSQFFEQIGRNTDYIIHPEEVLADNFAYLVVGKRGLPSPGILDKLAGMFSKTDEGDQAGARTNG